jgi:hypothetical protein
MPKEIQSLFHITSFEYLTILINFKNNYLFLTYKGPYMDMCMFRDDKPKQEHRDPAISNRVWNEILTDFMRDKIIRWIETNKELVS